VLSGWVYQKDALAQIKPSSLTAPYLVISEPRADGSEKPDETLVKQASAPVFLVKMPEMKHGAFNALEGIVPAITGVTTVQRWSLAGPKAKLGYEVAAQYVRRALAHYLYAVPTMDTPFPLWGPDGDIPEGFVSLETSGTPRPAPPQPKFTTAEFSGDDKVVVTADLYALNNKRAPIIVMAHQSGASRGEYRQAAPDLNQMGFNILAIDNRWGKQDRWNGVLNETAKRYGTEAIVASGDRAKIRAIDRERDLETAVDWARAQGFTGPLILWGSSITANGVLKIAAGGEHEVAALLAFSPGEYNPDDKTEMQSKVKGLRMPLLMACGEDEDELCKGIFATIPAGKKTYYRAPRGRHGSSILLDDPANWKPVREFLKSLARIETATR
jgi:dienelactone hydrolase